MIMRKWWNGPIDWAAVLRSIGWCTGGIAFMIAMLLAFTDDAEDDATIARQVVQIDRLQADVDGLRSQVDANKTVSDCRSRLALSVTYAQAEQALAESDLVAALLPTATRPNLQALATTLRSSNEALRAAVQQRRVYEGDTSQPCPVSEQEVVTPARSASPPPMTVLRRSMGSSTTPTTTGTSTTATTSPRSTVPPPTLCDLVPLDIAKELACPT